MQLLFFYINKIFWWTPQEKLGIISSGIQREMWGQHLRFHCWYTCSSIQYTKINNYYEQISATEYLKRNSVAAIDFWKICWKRLVDLLACNFFKNLLQPSDKFLFTQVCGIGRCNNIALLLFCCAWRFLLLCWYI